jgi:Tfp pilus assembly protein PilN
MSTLIDREPASDIAPGWNIYADLTPPELASSRRLRLIRRGVIVGFAVLLVLLVLAYIAVWDEGHRAGSALSREQTRTSTLQAQKQQYAEVIQIKGSIAEVNQQLSGLMAGDVDFTKLVGALRSALPAGMKISQIQLSVNPLTEQAPSGSNAAGGSSLDTSGQQRIGTITVSGSASKFTGLAAYAAALRKLDGVIDVDPESNMSDAKVFQFTVAMTVTDSRLTHRYNTGVGKK